MRSRDIIKYNQGKTVIVTMGEQKYVGTRMRDHYDYQQARLVFFGIFNVYWLWFKQCIRNWENNAKLDKNLKNKKCFDIQIYFH